MIRTLNNEKIHNCEKEYSKCFSNILETEDYVRFRDDLLPDMYYHNFTLIKKSRTDEELYHRIEAEIQLRKTEGESFCNIVSYVPISDYLLQELDVRPQVSVDGFYLFDVSKLSRLTNKEGAVVLKVNNLKMADDILRLDIEHDGERLGLDFCKRRTNRRKEVYLSKKGVNTYICYDNNEAIGQCDLLIYKDTAKIEDFSVLPAKQRQGYGTAILKAMLEVALSSGASTIYLVADEDGTAKEMYQNLGFSKIGEKIDLFFKL